MREDPVIQVTTTVNSEAEADRMGRESVLRRLGACAQVSGPITSHYRWKGELCSDTEWKVSIKTFRSLEVKLLTFLEEMHPYETPELASTPVVSVSRSYLEWMRQNLDGQSGQERMDT
jgi:periplasmic divalent cation tolerance protein